MKKGHYQPAYWMAQYLFYDVLRDVFVELVHLFVRHSRRVSSFQGKGVGRALITARSTTDTFVIIYDRYLSLFLNCNRLKLASIDAVSTNTGVGTSLDIE